MKKDAEENAEADKLARELIDKTNSAESLIFSIEKMITDTPNIPETGKKELEELVFELKDAVSSKVVAMIDEKMSKLQAKSGEIYQQMSSAQTDTPTDTSEPTPQDVEFEDVNVENK